MSNAKVLAVAPLSFVYLSRANSETLLACRGTAEIVATLKALLAFDSSSKEGRIQQDMYAYLVLFCQDNAFTSEKLSTMFSIMKLTLDHCVSTKTDNFSENFSFFKETLLKHAVHRPGFSACIFSLAECKLIVSYALNTFFRHFKLYKYVLAGPAEVELILNYPTPS